MLHEMKLQPGPFAAIKAGTKIFESRLFDEKRRQIQLDDEIVFRNAADLNETVTTKVVELRKYPTFSLLFDDFPPTAFGGESIKDLEDQIHSIYSKEDETKYGVLGIHIRLTH